MATQHRRLVRILSTTLCSKSLTSHWQFRTFVTTTSPRLIGAKMDITQKKEAEQELKSGKNIEVPGRKPVV